MCTVCGNDRCIGKYLLHPKELICVDRIKRAEHEVSPDRTFKMCISPNNPPFTEFKELHVIAGPDEDITGPLPEVKVYIGDMMDEIKNQKTIKEIILEFFKEYV